MSLRERLKRLFAGLRLLLELPSSDRAAFLRAWQALVVSRLRVRVGRVEWTEAVREEPMGDVAAVSAVDHLVAVFDRARETCPVGGSCLPRSLALRRFLDRHGVSARLRLGVRKIGQEWSGHAWVECQGRLVGDRPELVGKFVPFRQTA